MSRFPTTWLFVTSIDRVQIEAAAKAQPDCVIVDMEDFTPPHLREQGRRDLKATLRLIADAGAGHTQISGYLALARAQAAAGQDEEAYQSLSLARQSVPDVSAWDIAKVLVAIELAEIGRLKESLELIDELGEHSRARDALLAIAGNLGVAETRRNFKGIHEN